MCIHLLKKGLIFFNDFGNVRQRGLEKSEEHNSKEGSKRGGFEIEP